MDMVRKLILERLSDLGLNMAEVSVALGRNPTYLHQFMKRGVPAELHERERLKLAEILRVQEDLLRGPSVPLPKRHYEKKSGSARESSVDTAAHLPHSMSQGTSLRAVPEPLELFGGAIDLPVFGTAQGGQDGALIVSEYAVDYVARPPVLLRVRDGYGMIITDDSMWPEHKHGSVALVNPHLPPRVGDSCIFRSHRDDGTNLAIVKTYRGQTETSWKVSQHNPPKDFTLKKSDWQIVHRTVGSNFP